MHFPRFRLRVRHWLEKLPGEPADTARTLLEDTRTYGEIVEVCEISGVGAIPAKVANPRQHRRMTGQNSINRVNAQVNGHLHGLGHLLNVQRQMRGMTAAEECAFLLDYCEEHGAADTQRLIHFVLAGRIKGDRPSLSWAEARRIANRLLHQERRQTA